MKKFADQDIIKIVDAVRAGIAAFKHHQKFSGRVVKGIKLEICKALGIIDPEKLVVHAEDKGASSLGSLAIWGNGVDYNNRIYFCWNWNKSNVYFGKDVPHWSVPMLEECLRMDRRDYVERHQEEVKHADIWASREAEIKSLQSQIAAVRAAALNDCARMPVPPTALATGMRKADHFWNKPTLEARNAFPVLFGDK